MVHASRGKQTRAQPIATEFEHGRIHHVGVFPALEDEWCLRGDTLIATATGLRRLDRIRAGDWVWTSAGLRPVLRAGCTSAAAEVYELSTNTNTNLVGTFHHPVYHKGLRRFVPMGLMQYGDILEECSWREDGRRDYEASTDLRAAWESMGRKLNGMAAFGAWIVADITSISTACSMWLSGKMRMGQSPVDIMSTIKTTILRIMPWITWSYSPILPINDIMALQGLLSGIRRSVAKPCVLIGNAKNPIPFRVQPAVHSSYQPALALNTVPSSAVVVCTGVKKLPSLEPVYNLTVPEPHDYYANGLRVHNCFWVPGMASPNRLDAEVWLYSELLLDAPKPAQIMELSF
jgi:hypothetical protein